MIDSYPSLTTASINLDSLTSPLEQLIEYSVPSSPSTHFNLASSSAVSISIQPAHASQSFSYSPSLNSSAFINASVINNGFTLQLRWFCPFKLDPHPQLHSQPDPFSNLDQLASHPPVQFHFDHRLTPSPYLSFDPDDNSLIILAITERYTLYRLKFPGPLLFYEELFDQDWCSDYDVEAVVNRHIILSHGLDPNNLILSCSDGILTHLSWGRLVGINDNFGWKTSNLSTRPAIWSFLPSWSSSKTISSSAHEWVATPSSTIAIASHITAGASGEDGWLFTVGRDRRLRVWSLTSGSCVRELPLGTPSCSDPSLVSSQPDNSLLPAASRTLARFIYSDEGDDPTYEGFLVVFVPSAVAPSFVTYGLSITSENKFKDLVLLQERKCHLSLAGRKLGELRDFQLSKVDLSLAHNTVPSKHRPWGLWTIWDDDLGGEGVMQYTVLNETRSYQEPTRSSWATIVPPERGTPWNSTYFDELLANQTSSSVTQVFVDHLFQPGHFSPSDLEYALETYEAQLEHDPQSDYAPQDSENTYDSLEEKICAVVGANVRLEVSAVTGTPMMDVFHRKLRIEWLKFATMCAESRASALWPLELAVDADHQQVFVLSRRAITAPVLIDSASLLSLLARETFEHPKPGLLEHQSSEIGQLHPLLSNLQNRIDLVALVNAITSLTNALASSDALRPLEDELVQLVKRPAKLSVLDIAEEIFIRRLDPFIDDQIQTTVSERLNAVGDIELALQILWRILSTSELVRSADGEIDQDDNKSGTVLSKMLLADYLTNIVERRYELARNTVVFLLYLSGEDEQLVGDVASLLSQFLATYHRTCVARWVCQQCAKVPAELAFEDKLTDKLACLQGSGEASSQGVLETEARAATSLLSSLLLTRFIPDLSPALKLPGALAHAGSQFLDHAGLFPNLSGLSADELARTTVATSGTRTVPLVEFIVRVGLADLALELVEMYPDCGAGLHYLKAQALVELGMIEDAETSFIKAGSAISEYDENFETDDQSELEMILPSQACRSLRGYFSHLVSILEPVGVDLTIVKFCELAIEATGTEIDGEEEVEVEPFEKEEEELWNKLFKGLVNQGLWDDAYEVLMSMPSSESQHNCLRSLVSIMCEMNEVDKLLRFSFLGLTNEFERTIAFRARNSDPLVSSTFNNSNHHGDGDGDSNGHDHRDERRPNYYQILYCYYLNKGDYRSAAMAMYHHGRKIGEMAIKGGAFQLLMTQQCQSYLAAINALSLVPEKHAWVSLVCPKTVRQAGGYEEQGRRGVRRRRGVEYFVPEDVFTGGTGDVEAVGLREMREEYTLVLSRLQLANELPQLSQPGSATARAACLDGETLVPMFVNEGRVTEGLEKATLLGTDVEPVFVRLAESCARMTASGEERISVFDEQWVNGDPLCADWEGSVVSKAWELLKVHLEHKFPIGAKGEGCERGWKCREAVVEAILQTEASVKLPDWLIESFLEYRPDRLLKVFFKYDHLLDAFTVAIKLIEQAIQTVQQDLLNGSSPSSTTTPIRASRKLMIPYNDLDQLLALREEDLSEDHDEQGSVNHLTIDGDGDGDGDGKMDLVRLGKLQDRVRVGVEKWVEVYRKWSGGVGGKFKRGD